MPDTQLPWSVQIAFALLGALSLAFVAFFIVPASRVAHRLRNVTGALNRADAAPNADLGTLFEDVPGLEHPWREFRETLHEERATGAPQIAALRATVPAETFFTDSYIVDGPLATEFFKHLPGILTGIGIIGTFLGLLRGLRAFQISDDPHVAHLGLEQLMHGVSDAFMVSFAAISLAMIITFVEKLVVVRLYAGVRKLTQVIDERFKAGIGEEYLSRLVGAAERSTAQAQLLKDSLVSELKAVLIMVSQNQIKEFRTAQRGVGQYIGDTVTLQLKAPLQRLAEATEKVRGDQSAAVQQLMRDMLARFSERLQSLIGDQVSLHLVNELRDAVTQLQQIVQATETEQASTGAATRMVAETLPRRDRPQLITHDGIEGLAREIRSLVSDDQLANRRELQKLLNALSDKTTSLIRDLLTASEVTVTTMGTQVENVTTSLTAVTARLDAVVERLDSVSIEIVRGMNSGAEILAIAANDFARAGRGISDVLSRAELLSRELTQSSDALRALGEGHGELYEEMTTAVRRLNQTIGDLEQTLAVAVADTATPGR